MVEAALELGNREALHALRPYVAQYAGKNLVAGQFVALFGSGDRYLARIAACGADTRSAESHFDAALEMDRRMGSVVHVAETLARRAVFAVVARCTPMKPDAWPTRRAVSPRRSARSGCSTWWIRC